MNFIANECRRQYRPTAVDARDNERSWKQRWCRRRRAATTKSHQPMQKTLSSIVYCHWMHTHLRHFSSVHIVSALDFFCQSSSTLCISFLEISSIWRCCCCCGSFFFSPFVFGSNKRDLIVFIVRFYRLMLFFMAPSHPSQAKPSKAIIEHIRTNLWPWSTEEYLGESETPIQHHHHYTDNQSRMATSIGSVFNKSTFDFQTNQFIKLTGIWADNKNPNVTLRVFYIIAQI